MIKPTKEEISLLKQIAEKGVSFEPPDDWHGAYHVFHQDKTFSWADGEDKPYYKSDEFVWIATVSDCLEFLREKCQDHVLLIHEENLNDGEEWYLWFDEYKETQQWNKGKTPLEACLKVILAVI